jgi:threonine synthase
MTHHWTTICYACGTTGPAEAKRCACGEPVWFDTSELTTSAVAGGTHPNMWQYADTLPVDPPDDLRLAAGGTPLYRARQLDAYTGCEIWLKDETENPTGSFKDRGTAVGVTAAIARGRRAIATVSHGNMAMSTAALSTAAGYESVLFVPADISETRLALLDQYGPDIVRVDGDYGRLYHDVLELGADLDIEVVNSDTPLRVAGQKTIAYEICAAFSGGCPDGIVLPVSSGGQASAIWKGLRELHAAGRISDVPSLYLVQAAACDPIARAYEAGTAVEPLSNPEETIAYSIANADPPSGNRALAAVADTGGASISVSDAAITAAQRRVAVEAGLCVESSSAAAIAGLRAVSKEGAIDSTDEIAVIMTGSGFKEFAGEPSQSAPVVPLSELRQWVASVVA